MLILIDFDGVIVNPFKRYYAIHESLTKKYNLPSLSYSKYISSKRNKKPELFYLDKKYSEEENYLRERLELIEDPKFLSLDTLYSNVKPVLSNLQKNNILGLLTGRKKRQNLIDHLDHFGIKKYFSNIHSRSDPNTPEEGPQIKINLLREAIGEYDLSNIVIIGDTEADVAAGKHFGIKTIAIINGFRTRKYLEELKPDYLASNIREAAKLIDHPTLSDKEHFKG